MENMMVGKGDTRRPSEKAKGRNDWYDKVDWDNSEKEDDAEDK